MNINEIDKNTISIDNEYHNLLRIKYVNNNLWITLITVENLLLCKVRVHIAFNLATEFVYISYPP